MIQQLIEQKKALEEQIATAQREARAAALAQIKAIMTEAGLTVADLRGGKAPTGKAAPKFRDPVTGATWSGRGHQPKWMRDAVASGKAPTDFAV